MHVRVVFTLIEEAEIEQRFFQEPNSYKKVIILRYTKALGSVLIAPKQENWFSGIISHFDSKMSSSAVQTINIETKCLIRQSKRG